jgi:hypothetical protein
MMTRSGILMVAGLAAIFGGAVILVNDSSSTSHLRAEGTSPTSSEALQQQHISEVKNGTDNSVNLFASGSKKGGDEWKWTAVSSLSPYPGFTGDPVEGGVELSFHNNAVNISYQLKNIDRQCSNPDKATPNSCGIHIHEGKSCDDATKVGGHYYNKDLLTTDPWAAIIYGDEAVKQFEKNSGLFGGVNNLFFRTAVGRSKPIEIGFTFDETVGRTVVLHNYKGNRVTCNVIPSANWAKAHAIKDVAIAKINERKKAFKDAIQKKFKRKLSASHAPPALAAPLMSSSAKDSFQQRTKRGAGLL